MESRLRGLMTSGAGQLGLDITGPKIKCQGVTGNADAILSRATVTVREGPERHVITISIMVLQTDETMDLLLGQEGFFDNFKITFDKRDGKFSLKKIDNEVRTS